MFKLIELNFPVTLVMRTKNYSENLGLVVEDANARNVGVLSYHYLINMHECP